MTIPTDGSTYTETLLACSWPNNSLGPVYGDVHVTHTPHSAQVLPSGSLPGCRVSPRAEKTHNLTCPDLIFSALWSHPDE
jgi:hypothetical protein